MTPHRSTKFPPWLRDTLAAIVIVGAALWLLSGCVGPAADRPSRAEVDAMFPPMPPMPAASADVRVQSAEAIPLPPRQPMLIWNPSPDHNKVAHYTIWASPTLPGLFLPKYQTIATNYLLTADLPTEFFMLNCTGTNGLESEFAGTWK